MNPNDKVAIVLLNYNGYEDTIECVKSLSLHIQSYKIDIVIVDNASSDESSEKIKAFIGEEKVDNIYFIQCATNEGFSQGNNVGIDFAMNQLKSEYFWILNNDTVVKEDALKPLVEALKQDKEIGILGSLLLFYHRPSIIQATGGTFRAYKARIKQEHYLLDEKELKENGLKEVDFAIGASLFVSKLFIEKVGHLAEDYFLYFEELDWAERARKHGFKTYVNLASKVYHKQGASTKNHVYSKKNREMMYFQFRNLILFYKKFYPSLQLIAFLMVALRVIKFALIQDIRFLNTGLKVYNYHLR